MTNRILRSGKSPIIRISDAPPYCPLCEKQMREVWTKKGLYYVCTEEFCMISIKRSDPCCGKWLEKWPENAPKCPLCGEAMRWFFRADRFMKCQCRGEHEGKKHRFVQVMRGDASMLPPLTKE